MLSPAQFLKNQKHQANSLIRGAIGLSVFNGVLLIAQAWCLAQVVNGVVFAEQTLNQVMPWIGAMGLLILLRTLLAYSAEQVATAAAIKVKTHLRERLYQHLCALGPGYLNDERTGELSSTLADGIEALDAYYARYLPAMSLAAFLPLSILVIVFPIDWQSGLVMLITAPLIPFFMILIGKGAEKLNQAQWEKLQRMSGHFLDVLQGLTTLKLFNASRREAKTVAKMSEAYRHATMRVLRVAFLSALALEFFATISIAIVAVLIGFRLLWGDIPFVYGFFVLLLAPEFYLPLRTLGTQYHARMSAIGSADSILSVLNTPLPEVQQKKHHSLGNIEKISFNNIGVEHTADVPTLQHIDLTIQAGEHIALVGPTGAGKTTLLNTLLGFIQPAHGQVLVNGIDLPDIEAKVWHQHIAWVPQRPTLFHTSVADNIRLGLQTALMSDVEQAARQANAYDFIQQLPQGFDTLLGDGGRVLSGGQVQRIALARAFLRNAEIIILDEATANIDQATEQQIQQAINRLTKGRMLIAVAHRLNTIRHADRIYVLQQGQIIQQGTHSELQAQAGLYQSLTQQWEVGK